jgi:hypothetical protein
MSLNWALFSCSLTGVLEYVKWQDLIRLLTRCAIFTSHEKAYHDIKLKTHSRLPYTSKLPDLTDLSFKSRTLFTASYACIYVSPMLESTIQLPRMGVLHCILFRTVPIENILNWSAETSKAEQRLRIWTEGGCFEKKYLLNTQKKNSKTDAPREKVTRGMDNGNEVA